MSAVNDYGLGVNPYEDNIDRKAMTFTADQVKDSDDEHFKTVLELQLDSNAKNANKKFVKNTPLNNNQLLVARDNVQSQLRELEHTLLVDTWGMAQRRIKMMQLCQDIGIRHEDAHMIVYNRRPDMGILTRSLRALLKPASMLEDLFYLPKRLYKGLYRITPMGRERIVNAPRVGKITPPNGSPPNSSPQPSPPAAAIAIDQKFTFSLLPPTSALARRASMGDAESASTATTAATAAAGRQSVSSIAAIFNARAPSETPSPQPARRPSRRPTLTPRDLESLSKADLDDVAGTDVPVRKTKRVIHHNRSSSVMDLSEFADRRIVQERIVAQNACCKNKYAQAACKVAKAVAYRLGDDLYDIFVRNGIKNLRHALITGAIGYFLFQGRGGHTA